MQEAIIKDLNDLLKGTHLALDLFDDYYEKCNCDSLKLFLKDSIKTLRSQESALEMHVDFLGGKINDMLKLEMMFADFMGKMKTILVVDDQDIRKKTKEGLEMGVKACSDFLCSHKEIESTTHDIVANMIDGYKYLLKELDKIASEKKCCCSK